MTKKRQQSAAAPEATTSTKNKSLLRREWPLLLYPTLVLVALAILYVANRSLQNLLTQPTSSQRTDQKTTAASFDPNFGPAGANTATAQASMPSEANGLTAPNQAIPAIGRTFDPNAPATTLAQGGQDSPQSTAQLLRTLRHALATKDQAKIKECMNALVAMGDEAVPELAELIANSDDETALWAAEALARIGTPAAACALLDTLEQLEDSTYKEQLAKRVSNITNHESWPILLDYAQDSTDVSVQRSAAASLAKMADTAIIDEIVARYEAAETQEEADFLAEILSNISSSAASDALLALAGEVSNTVDTSLEEAVISALAEIGDAQSVSYLLQKLESSSPGQESYLYSEIASIDSSTAQSALLYAAAGNKEVSAERGRTAAITALANYPTEETCQLLEYIIANEDNTAVVTAAVRTLQSIEKTSPAIVESAAAKETTTNYGSSDPLQK